MAKTRIMAPYRYNESGNSESRICEIYIFKQMQRLFWIDLPGNVFCPLSKLICGLAIIRFMTLYGYTCLFALNVVILHDPDPGPSLSRCIISVKYCSQGIPKASFYKGDVCVLVEQQKLTFVKFRRFTLNVVINDQRNESQRNSNLTRSIVAAKNEGLGKEGGQMVSTLSTPST